MSSNKKRGRPTALQSIQKLVEKQIEAAYQRGLEEGREKALDALEKAWAEIEK